MRLSEAKLTYLWK